MNTYKVDFSFYIVSGNEDSIANKDNLLDKLDMINNIDVYDVYDDGEDWCVNCIAEMKAKNIKGLALEMKKMLDNIKTTWDYHYIRGIIDDDDEYWQP